MARHATLANFFCGCLVLGAAFLPLSKGVQETETYLFPVLRYGPNNQKRDLRWAAALAKQLNCTLVLTGIFKHYADVNSAREAEAKHREQLLREQQSDLPLIPRALLSQTESGSDSQAWKPDNLEEWARSTSDLSAVILDKPLSVHAEAAVSLAERLSAQPQSHSGGDTIFIGTAHPTEEAAETGAGPAARSPGSGGRSMQGTSPSDDVGGQKPSHPGPSAGVPPTPLTDLPQCFEENKFFFLDYDWVLDRKSLAAFTRTITVAELKTSGWDGKLDAVLMREGLGDNVEAEYHKAIMKTTYSTGTMLRDNHSNIRVRAPVGCDPAILQQMEKAVKTFRVVLVIMFAIDWSEMPNYAAILGPPPEDNSCQGHLWHADRTLRHATWIQDIAKRFIREALGEEPFLAVHVRPYPDECLDGWKHEVLNTTDMDWKCKKPLHELLPSKVRETLAKMDKSPRVFIMAHPAIRHSIHLLLDKVGVQPIYLVEDVMYRIAGCVDNTATFMAMVEEEVAVQAPYFVGTASSSITQSIVVERLAIGNEQIDFLDHSVLPRR